MLELTAPVFAY